VCVRLVFCFQLAAARALSRLHSEAAHGYPARAARHAHRVAALAFHLCYPADLRALVSRPLRRPPPPPSAGPDVPPAAVGFSAWDVQRLHTWAHAARDTSMVATTLLPSWTETGDVSSSAAAVAVVADPSMGATVTGGWTLAPSPLLQAVQTIVARLAAAQAHVNVFTCIIPKARAPRPVAAVAVTRPHAALAPSARDEAKLVKALTTPAAPLHATHVRQQLYFPDKRLLQYDCGKLQALAELLRTLKAGGHRALIFTQMTKMLDVLELFINMYQYTYVV
jgi:hypothetical protein